jgi:nucleoside triphosphatase
MSEFPRGVELVGSAIIENDQGEILLTQSPKWNNKWTLPGGHIEPGEIMDDAINREAEEETGLRLQHVAVIAWGQLINSKDFHRPAHFIYFDVYCRIIGGNLKLDGDELTDYKWLTPQKALELDLAESFPESIQDFIKFKNSLS